MLPEWAPPCGNQCTQKFAALTQIPWRVFCKKGCGADGDTWEECLEQCEEICYKDPVLQDQKWSAYIDRSPGAVVYSQKCFHACVAGCGYKYNIPSEKVDQVHPNRQTTPPLVQEPKQSPPAPSIIASPPPPSSLATTDILSTSA